MRKQIALMATVAALAISPALAQTTAPNQDMKTTPQAQPTPQGQTPAPSTGPSTTAPSTSPSKSATAPASAGQKFVNTQTSDQWLASDLMGLRVTGNGDENIGSISDLLVDKDGNIVAAVIGVGGFLGIGQKDVAISFDSLNVTQDKDGNPQARLSLSKKELEGAPDFKSMADVKSEAARPATPPAGSGSTPPRKN
jgi:hypothetical protein